MAEENTTAVESIEFRAKDLGASAIGDKLSHAFERLHHASEGAREKIGEFGKHAAIGMLGAMGVGYGLHAMADKAKEANLELERVRRSIAGSHFAFLGWKAGISSVDKMKISLGEAADVTERLATMGHKLRVPLESLGTAYNSMASIGFSRLGLSQERVISLTEKMAAAARVYGVSTEEATYNVTRALLTGNTRAVGPFGIALRNALGIGPGGKHHKAALGTEEMLKRIEKQFGDIVPAAQLMGQNMEGSLEDLRATTSELFRDLTGKTFAQGTKGLSDWATKLREMREDGRSMMSIYGDKLASAFESMKSATGFMADHWKAIAAVWGASKLANLVGGWGGAGKAAAGVGGIAGAMAGTMTIHAAKVDVYASAQGMFGPAASALEKEAASSLRPSMAETTNRMLGMASRACMVTEALGALYVGAEGLSKYLLGLQDQQIATSAAAPRTMTALTSGAKAFSSAMNERSTAETMGHLKTAFGAYGLKPGQNLSAATIANELRAMAPELAAKQIAMYGIKGASAKSVQGAGFVEESAGRIAAALNGLAAQLLAAGVGKDAHAPLPRQPKINIGTLNITQEFKEADPDRVFHKVIGEVNNMARNPSGALTGNSAGVAG